MQRRTKRIEIRLTEDEYAHIKEKCGAFQGVGAYIRSAIEEFSNVNVRQRLDLMKDLGDYYLKYRDEISHISGNLNQSVKRANELAIAGLLTQSYLSQVLLPTISSAQRTLSTFHDELFKVTKKAVRSRQKTITVSKP